MRPDKLPKRPANPDARTIAKSVRFSRNEVRTLRKMTAAASCTLSTWLRESALNYVMPEKKKRG